MRFVCTRCHHWIQKKIWRRQCDIWRGPINFWVRGSSQTLIDYTTEDGSLVCPVKVRCCSFFLVLVIYFLFNLIILSGQLLPYSLFQCLLESPFTIQFWMADDLFGGHTHIPHIDSDERDSDNTYRF